MKECFFSFLPTRKSSEMKKYERVFDENFHSIVTEVVYYCNADWRKNIMRDFFFERNFAIQYIRIIFDVEICFFCMS